VIITAYHPSDVEESYLRKSSGKNKSKESDLLKEAEEWDSGKRGSISTKASDEEEMAIDEVMWLQMISIRLPQQVVEKLKYLAQKGGLGYQPYNRQALIHQVEGDYNADKLHDIERRLKSVERKVFKKTGG
jgi:predicted DNA binding CopG/RHH family protein